MEKNKHTSSEWNDKALATFKTVLCAKRNNTGFEIARNKARAGKA